MILIECENDEAVVRGLGFARRQVDHHASKGRAIKALETASGVTVAMVDEDPGAGVMAYFREFKEIEKFPSLRMRRLCHPHNEKWIIELAPDLEPWLIDAAQDGGIPLRSFHLPETKQGLHGNPKAYADRLRLWTVAMLAAGSPRMVKLNEWLQMGCER